MSDYMDKPYAEFIEAAVRFIFDFDPSAIGIYAVNGDGDVASSSFMVRSDERLRIVRSLLQDELFETLRANGPRIREMIELGEMDEAEREARLDAQTQRLQEIIDKFAERFGGDEDDEEDDDDA